MRNWREFAAEVGTIVLGVLIALGAEQAVEALHWTHQVHEAVAAMRAELTQNNEDAYYRLATEPCGNRRLDGIEAALIASRDHDAVVPLQAPYSRPRRPWQNDAWESARALQITSHIPTARLTAYSSAYFFPSVLRTTQPREREALAAINTLTVNAGRLQPAERDRLFLALAQARGAAFDTALGAWLLLQRTQTLGIALTEAEKRGQLAPAREDYGDCVAAPDLSRPPPQPGRNR